MKRTLISAVVILFLVTPAAAHAQDTLSVAARLVVRQPVGAIVRVQTGSEQVTGAIDRIAGGTLYLGSPPQPVLLTAIDDAWLQQRSAGKGGKVGAIVGGVSGALVTVVGLSILSGLCDYNCDDPGATYEYALGALVGGAVGAGAGYLVGALIGSSIPRWERLTDPAALPPARE